MKLMISNPDQLKKMKAALKQYHYQNEKIISQIKDSNTTVGSPS